MFVQRRRKNLDELQMSRRADNDPMFLPLFPFLRNREMGVCNLWGVRYCFLWGGLLHPIKNMVE